MGGRPGLLGCGEQHRAEGLAHGVAEADVADESITEEGGRPVLGAVDELVDQHHMARNDGFSKRA